MGILDDIKKGIGEVLGNRGQNEFRDVRQEDFLAPGFEERNKRFQNLGANFGGSEFRGDQRFLADQLRRQTSGEMSLAGEQLRQAAGRNVAMQQAMAAGARPQNAALAARAAAQNAANINTGLAGQQAIAGIQEQQAAANALAGLLGQARGQDLQAQLGFGGLELQGVGLQQQGMQNFQNARTARFGTLAGIPTPQEQLLTAGGDVAAAIASDRRLKKDIGAADKDVDEFLKKLKAQRFRYKDAKHGEGQQFGIMAQELERSAVGKSAVFEGPDGKMVDTRRLSTALAAAASRLNERLSQVEKRLGGKG